MRGRFGKPGRFEHSLTFTTFIWHRNCLGWPKFAGAQLKFLQTISGLSPGPNTRAAHGCRAWRVPCMTGDGCRWTDTVPYTNLNQVYGMVYGRTVTVQNRHATAVYGCTTQGYLFNSTYHGVRWPGSPRSIFGNQNMFSTFRVPCSTIYYSFCLPLAAFHTSPTIPISWLIL